MYRIDAGELIEIAKETQETIDSLEECIKDLNLFVRENGATTKLISYVDFIKHVKLNSPLYSI